MSLSILIRGTKLTQEQLDAITPIVDLRMQKLVSAKQFEVRCLQAMEDAGCPLVEAEGASA